MLRQKIQQLIDDLDSSLRRLREAISQYGFATALWAEEQQKAADANKSNLRHSERSPMP